MLESARRLQVQRRPRHPKKNILARRDVRTLRSKEMNREVRVSSPQGISLYPVLELFVGAARGRGSHTTVVLV